MPQPFFITIEGCEGSGKSTLMKSLFDHLVALGRDVKSTYEPGGTEVGSVLRNCILNDVRFEAILPKTELFLFLASRIEHVETVILPHLKRGGIVLCDRYIDSTIAYQAYGRGIAIDDVKALCALATPLLPDYTIYLDIDVAISQKRIQKRQGAYADRIEKCDMEFHARVLEGFRLRVEEDPNRFSLIDARMSEQDVAKEAIARINALIKTKESAL